MVARRTLWIGLLLAACTRSQIESPEQEQSNFEATAPAREVCYQRSDAGRSGQAVEVRAAFDVTPFGHTAHVSIQSTPPDPGLETCYRELLEGLEQRPGATGSSRRFVVLHCPSGQHAVETAMGDRSCAPQAASVTPHSAASPTAPLLAPPDAPPGSNADPTRP